MNYLIINSVCGIGSTGRICLNIAKEIEATGNNVRIAYGRGTVPKEAQKYAVRIGTELSWRVHAIKTRLFDLHGFSSSKATIDFLKWADEYKPDVIWLHNIHGYYINIEILFAWIKKHPSIEVKWTLHDCWAFTGHCSHFSFVKCNQWQKECTNCPQRRSYPKNILFSDISKNFKRKKIAFSGVKNLTLITPSKWLADLTRNSFLNVYPVKVEYNTIDNNIFKPTYSDFRNKYGLQNKYIILGVANNWDERKGIQDFYKLAQMLNDSYVIVLVGLTKKQINEVPKIIKGYKLSKGFNNLNNSFVFSKDYKKEQNKIFLGNDDFKMIDKKNEFSRTNCRETNLINGSLVVEQNIEALYMAITGNKFQRCLGLGCDKIICLLKTKSAHDLASLYTVADIFVNPTYEDTYPTVNLEALACGTKVITYDTGGCRETLVKRENLK